LYQLSHRSFTNNFKNNTLKAIIGVITNWLPQENPIMRFRSPTLSIEFNNYNKHNHIIYFYESFFQFFF
jgi:hypothetical protein